jgi:hypothetical protein
MDFEKLSNEQFFEIVRTMEIIDQIATRARLLDMKDELHNEIVEIDEQLERATSTYVLTGEKANPEWFSKAKMARKIKVRQIQKLQHMLSIIKQMEKQHNIKVASDHFRQATETLVSDEALARIIELAREMGDNT